MENLLELINKSALKFLVPTTPDETYKLIVKEAVNLIGGYYGSIMLEEHGELRRVYASRKIAFRTKNRRVGYTREAFSKRKTIIVDSKTTSMHHPEIQELGIKWTLFIPLSYQNKSIGVLIINSQKEEKYDKKELNALKLYGSLASLAIRNTQLLNESKRALETRDLFISLASHELKTPLTTISGYVQLLEKKLKNVPTSEGKWIVNLSKETRRLTNLVKELLEINQIKSGKFLFDFKECDMIEVVNQAIDNFKFAYPHTPINITNSVKKQNLLIVGDCDKLLQVLTNVLNNAAKFSTSDDNIQIDLTTHDKNIIISISDRGLGINPSDIPKIFEGFYKGKNNRKEGMGLGLFLSKYVIDSHKGSISIESEVNKGTAVKISLPASG